MYRLLSYDGDLESILKSDNIIYIETLFILFRSAYLQFDTRKSMPTDWTARQSIYSSYLYVLFLIPLSVKKKTVMRILVTKQSEILEDIYYPLAQ